MRCWPVLLLMALLCAAPAAAAQRVLLLPAPQADAAATPAAVGAGHIAALRRAAAAKGTLRVIVGLRVPFAPEGLLGAGERAAQRRDIQSAAVALRARFSTAMARNRGAARSYASIPFLAFAATPAEIDRLAADPAVISIEEDRMVPPTLEKSTVLISARASWAAGYTGLGQTVAIIDSGVDKDHPFLAGKVVSEACYSAGGNCPGGATSSTAPGAGVPCAQADCDHGTHVAGIATGKGTAFSGVAPDAKLIAIMVFSAKSTGGIGAYNSDILAGLNRVYELRDSYSIAAVNLSLGGGKYQSSCDTASPATTAAISNLRSAGIAAVISSGNDGYTDAIAWPSCISSAVSVGAVFTSYWSEDIDKTPFAPDKVPSFSNTASILTLLAPGGLITSSVPGGGFLSMMGTSMAAPHVAGAWAVLKQRFPSETVAQILARLRNTGKPVSDFRVPSIVTPRIDVATALALPDVALRVQSTGTGSGSLRIASPTDSRDCAADCTFTYPFGRTLGVEPTAALGSRFDGWSGPCSGKAACSFDLAANTTLSATFTKVFEPFVLRYVPVGKGSGAVRFITVTDGVTDRILCSAACSIRLAPGTMVTAQAETIGDTSFNGWAGICSGSADCSFEATGDRAVYAMFSQPGEFILQTVVRYAAAGRGSGTVRLVAPNDSKDCSTDCILITFAGAPVTATAVADDGSSFAGWSGPCSGTAACSFDLAATTLLTATFTKTITPPPQVVLGYAPAGDGTGVVRFTTPAGTQDCSAACAISLAAGDSVTAVALPGSGARFDGWSGLCSGTGGCSFTLAASGTLTASFAAIVLPPPQVVLGYAPAGDGTGVVRFTTPAGTQDCGAACAISLAAGDSVTAVALPGSGARFDGWSGPCSGNGSCRFTLAASDTLTARFTKIVLPPPDVTLSYVRAGAGGGTVQITTPATSRRCSASCSMALAPGTQVTVTASAAGGARFDGWSGPCSGRASCSFTLAGATTLTGRFASLPLATLSYVKLGRGGGSVSFAPAGGAPSCTRSCSQNYRPGTVVKLTAQPARGARFTGWSGDCTGRAACTLTMSRARSVRATFTSN